MYLVSPPNFLQWFFSDYTWCIPSKEKCVYLTFDDGPTPHVTEKVLNVLDEFDAKATFFCLGKNVIKYPEIYKKVQEKGHSVGNHTQSHLNGWRTRNQSYFDDVKACKASIDSNLFRPPYGRIKPSQSKFLKKEYHIIMWDVLSGDFDPNISPENCLSNVLNNVKPGSIIVFHDSRKTEKVMLNVLPNALKKLKSRGYSFMPIEFP